MLRGGRGVLPVLLGCAAVLACSGSGNSGSQPVDSGASDAVGDAVADASDGAAEIGPAAVADGTLAEWKVLSPMPRPGANHCSAVVSGHVVVVGGNHKEGAAFVKTDDVLVAKIAEKGGLGTWRAVGKTSSPVTECTATGRDDTLLVSDGIYDGASDGSQVIVRTLSAESVLAPVSKNVALPKGRRTLSSAAWTRGDLLYVMSVQLPDAGDVVGTLRMTGASGSAPTFAPTFAIDDWLRGFRGRPQYAFTGSYVYVLGGYLGADKGNVAVDDVQGAKVGADGSIGAPFVTEKLPYKLTFGQAIAVDDYVFVLGGREGALGPPPHAEVWSATRVGSDRSSASASRAAAGVGSALMNAFESNPPSLPGASGSPAGFG